MKFILSVINIECFTAVSVDDCIETAACTYLRSKHHYAAEIVMRLEHSHLRVVQHQFSCRTCFICIAVVNNDKGIFRHSRNRHTISCGIEIAVRIVESAGGVNRTLLLLITAVSDSMAAVDIDSALGLHTVRAASDEEVTVIDRYVVVSKNARLDRIDLISAALDYNIVVAGNSVSVV